ncbi:acyl-Coenzyme A oxidase [Blyttiomyces sp. JEL0837]|nr:acyl-Coenzyme A oxidase [Blyttiomyces sp. JEL0837]
MAMTSLTDIERERRAGKASYQTADGINLTTAMRHYIEGGPEASRMRDLAYMMIERDPILSFKDGHPYDLTRKEYREKTMMQIRRCVEIKRTMGKDTWTAVTRAMSEYSGSFGMRLGVHTLIFTTALSFFGTDEQRTEWLPLADNLSIIGSFSMTELGHSSSLRDLETTATFDLEHDDWILHSPTLTSTKWWIGMMGQTATHTVIIAQTIVNGKNIGLNWFILQLRDMETGRLMPGVTCGDIGAKAGRNGLDNGWVQLTHVRIPRTNMLMRWCQVSKDGEVNGPAHPAVMYATLIPERLTMMFSVRMPVGKALTIACRYGVTRRQGSVNEQIIDYQAQQVNLMPALAGLYVMQLAARLVFNHWDHVSALSDTNPAEYAQYLPDIHATSAGLKATLTWWGGEILELCRRTCGGHAYSSYSGIPALIEDYGVNTTGMALNVLITKGGGDNFPMAIQCARYVLRCVERGLNGKKGNIASGEYLNDAATILKRGKCAVNSKSDDWLNNLDLYLDLLSFAVVGMAKSLGEQIAAIKKANASSDPFDDVSNQLIKLSTLHSHVHLLQRFKECLVKNPPIAELKQTLMTCATLFAADIARKEAATTVLEYGYISSDQARAVSSAVMTLCKRVREDVVFLTDALGFPDFMLMSSIGRADGNNYEDYFETVKKAPHALGPTPYFESHIKPILMMGKL